MVETKTYIIRLCCFAPLMLLVVTMLSCSQGSSSTTEGADVDSVCSPGFFWREGIYSNIDVNFKLKGNGEISGYIYRQADSIAVDTIKITGHWCENNRLIINVGAIVVDARCKDSRFMTYEGTWKSPNGVAGVFFVSRDEGKDAVKQRELQRIRNEVLAQEKPVDDETQPSITKSMKTDAKIQYSVTSTRKLTENELINLSLDDLRIIRNEIYARHGRMFKSSSLRNYFSAYTWYEPKAYDDAKIEREFNAFERYNVSKIESVETKKKKNNTTLDVAPTETQPQSSSEAIPEVVAAKITQTSISLGGVLTESQLQSLTAEQLGYLRNEIYARHGLEFKTAKMRNYFNQFEWYKKLPKQKDVTKKLTAIDRQNLELIQRMERQKK